MPDHFDLLAPIYDRAIRLHNPQFIIQNAGLPTHGVLLDAGGGTGRIGFSLRKYVSRVVVADLSLHMLRKAASKNGLLPVCSMSEHLPFPNDSFERIIIVDALHHVYNAELVTKELWRTLKPGGRIVIEEPDIKTTIVKVLAIVEKLALMRSKFISPENIAQFFTFPAAKVQIERQGYTAWIIIDKSFS